MTNEDGQHEQPAVVHKHIYTGRQKYINARAGLKFSDDVLCMCMSVFGFVSMLSRDLKKRKRKHNYLIAKLFTFQIIILYYKTHCDLVLDSASLQYSDASELQDLSTKSCFAANYIRSFLEKNNKNANIRKKPIFLCVQDLFSLSNSNKLLIYLIFFPQPCSEAKAVNHQSNFV